jgi:hypothetical protein
MSRGAAHRAGLGPFGRVIAIAAPAVTALTLAAIVALPPSEPDDELQLLAPERVPAGAIVPLRAHLYAGLGRAEGPSLVAAPTSVELRGPDWKPWARATLRGGFGATLEGELRAPPDRSGIATLIARASYQGVRLTVERPLRVDPPGTARTATTTPVLRELPPLRSLSLGPLRALGPEPPSALAARVRGGTCIPEAPCELLVHVGEPAASVIAEPSPSVSAAGTQPSPTATSGVIALLVTPHGPEAELSVRAERAGVPVARRAVRLPLALGGNAFASMPDVLAPDAVLPIAGYGSEPGCIVDAFVDGRWARSGSLRDCTSPARAPFAALEPGLWRVQLRRDRFSSDNAAVHTVYVAPPGAAPAAVSALLAHAALAFDPTDELARALAARPDPDPAHDAGNARYLLAVLDRGVSALPAASSSYAPAVLRLQATRGELRRLGLLALGACGLTLAALLGQRGLHAVDEAAGLLLAAGSTPRAVKRARARMGLRVVATLCALLLAFAAIAAYVVARAAAG